MRDLDVGNALVRDGCNLFSLERKAFSYCEIFHSISLFVVNFQKLDSVLLMV